jgi:AcrR family transcriptional regulator
MFYCPQQDIATESVSLFSLTGEPTVTARAPAPPAATRARILDAAERCMRRWGLRRMSMADVGSEAGLSRASVYRYFPDRSALVDAVLERLAGQFVAASEPTVDRGETLAEQVAAAVRFIVDNRDDESFSLGLPADSDSLFTRLLTTHQDRLFAEWVAFWQPRLARARDRGEVDLTIDPARAGEWIVRFLFSFAVFPASPTTDLAARAALQAFVHDHLITGLKGPHA